MQRGRTWAGADGNHGSPGDSRVVVVPKGSWALGVPVDASVGSRRPRLPGDGGVLLLQQTVPGTSLWKQQQTDTALQRAAGVQYVADCLSTRRVATAALDAHDQRVDSMFVAAPYTQPST